METYEMSHTTEMYVNSIGQAKQYLLSHLAKCPKSVLFEERGFPRWHTVIVGQDGTAYVVDFITDTMWHVQAIYGIKSNGMRPETMHNLVFFLRDEELKFKD